MPDRFGAKRYERIGANALAIAPDTKPPVPFAEEYQSGQRKLTKYERFALKKAFERYQPIDEAAKQLHCSKEALIAVMLELADDPWLLNQLRNKFKETWLRTIQPRPHGTEQPAAEGRDEVREVIADVKEELSRED